MNRVAPPPYLGKLGVALLALVALTAAACGGPWPPSEGDLSGFFPHGEDWVLGGHWDGGRNDLESCLVCHEEMADDGAEYFAGEAPPCNGCHGWPLPPRAPVDDEEGS